MAAQSPLPIGLIWNISNCFRLNCKFTSLRQDTDMPQAYYAVKTGHRPGVYNTWDECKAQVSGYSNAIFKKFKELSEAERFVQQRGSRGRHSSALNRNGNRNGNSAFYAVQLGSCPGIYNTWAECQKAVGNYKYPKFQKFMSWEEANTFFNAADNSNKNNNNNTEVILTTYQNPTTSGSLTLGSRTSIKRKLDQADTKPAKCRKTQFIEFANLPGQTSGVVYTDGACANNGRKGSKGGLGVYWGPGHQMNISQPLEGRQTNNRAEIMAAVTAIQQAKSIGLKELKLYTDSRFMIRGITDWIEKWKQNGWKLSTGEPVKNKEDFEALDEARNGIVVHFEHVRGHRGVLGNEAADRLAKAAVY